MRTILILFLYCFAHSASGQLSISDSSQKALQILDLVEFNRINTIDYAVYTYRYPPDYNEDLPIYAFIEQHGKWYTATFTRVSRSIKPLNAQALKPVIYTTKEIAKGRADSLLHELQPDSAFVYTQEQLNKLPLNCESLESGKEIFSDTFWFGGRCYLHKIKGLKESMLSYYIDDFLITACRDTERRAQMLNPFYHTVHGLREMTGSTSPFR